MIGQTSTTDLSNFISADGNFDDQAFREWLNDYNPGSLFNSPFAGGKLGGSAGWTVFEWRAVVGQIQQLALNHGSGLPLLFGIDSIHGASYVRGAALFPQPIGLAATFNEELVQRIGEITGRDSAAAGLPWVFAPILGIATQPLWPRVYETFGEDPYLASVMGASSIQGIQSQGAAACMKHFIGYSAPRSGRDRSPSWIPYRHLLAYYVPPFQAAVEAGVQTTMSSYNDLNGEPLSSSSTFLIDLLRDSIGFEGVLVTDYDEITNLNSWHQVSSGFQDAVQLAMSASIDIGMYSSKEGHYEDLIELLEDGDVTEQRIQSSVLRILRLKDSLGLLGDSFSLPSESEANQVGSDEDWDLAIEAAEESIVLLKNKHQLLPLDPSSYTGSQLKKILVAGPLCNNSVAQTGGWTFHWQGATSSGEFTRQTTIIQGIQNHLEGESADIVYVEGVGFNQDFVSNEELEEAANSSDLIIACIGEPSYTEKPGDITDLTMEPGMLEMVEMLADHEAPVILLLVQGRPRLLEGLADQVDSILHCFLPGPEGGVAIANILFGATNPSGVLPYTYPKDSNSLVQYYRTVSQKCTDSQNNYLFVDCKVEWWFGHGLAYNNYTYANVETSLLTQDQGYGITISDELESDTFSLTLTVTNTGDTPGKHTILIYAFDEYRAITPEHKMLKAFKKVEVQTFVSSQVSISLNVYETFAYVGTVNRYVIEPGIFYLGLGSAVNCRVEFDPDLCLKVDVNTKDGDIYEVPCSAYGHCIQEIEYLSIWDQDEVATVLVAGFFLGLFFAMAASYLVYKVTRYTDLDERIVPEEVEELVAVASPLNHAETGDLSPENLTPEFQIQQNSSNIRRSSEYSVPSPEKQSNNDNLLLNREISSSSNDLLGGDENQMQTKKLLDDTNDNKLPLKRETDKIENENKETKADSANALINANPNHNNPQLEKKSNKPNIGMKTGEKDPFHSPEKLQARRNVSTDIKHKNSAEKVLHASASSSSFLPEGKKKKRPKAPKKLAPVKMGGNTRGKPSLNQENGMASENRSENPQNVKIKLNSPKNDPNMV